ncbi:MAG: hypothetical protein U0586_07265 [Candidatus Brocadiaceae bacterium]
MRCDYTKKRLLLPGLPLAFLIMLIVLLPAKLTCQEMGKESIKVKGEDVTKERIREQRWNDILRGKAPGVVTDRLSAPHAVSQSGTDPIFPQPPDYAQVDKITLDSYQASLREYYNYRRSGLQHRQRVFEWQHYSSITIFIVVLLLVIAGIYFAAIQFHRDFRQTTPGGRSEDAIPTAFEASLQGVKVSSPVLGVIILVISLAFFYLYLAFVYPIHEVF